MVRKFWGLGRRLRQLVPVMRCEWKDTLRVMGLIPSLPRKNANRALAASGHERASGGSASR